jgi:predicted amidohydrolase
VIAATTVNAAMALKRPELGSLKPGSIGDATILSVQQGKFDCVDVVGEHMAGDKRIVSDGVVIAGHWWHPRLIIQVPEVMKRMTAKSAHRVCYSTNPASLGSKRVTPGK